MTNNKIYIVANWKMFGNLNSLNSINNVINLSKIKKFKKTQIIYCPPYTLLESFIKKTKNSKILVGAQNCHKVQKAGSYTGSISSNMIKKIGCKYIILGHSENRISGDTDTDINLKIKSSLNERLKIIFCIGETLNQKKTKKTFAVLRRQILKGLKKVRSLQNVMIAYEPVWAIGTGITPRLDDLKKQLKNINKIIKKKFKNQNVKILYGGSVNPKNIVSLSQINEISGFLVGGASQNQKKFIDIIKKTTI